MRHPYPFTRREVLRAFTGLVAGLGMASLGRAAEGGVLPHLADSNPAAASLSYTEDTNHVDARKYPEHTAQQRCANCGYFDPAHGGGGPYAPCRLYPGNAVNVNGWCAGYASVAALSKKKATKDQPASG